MFALHYATTARPVVDKADQQPNTAYGRKLFSPYISLKIYGVEELKFYSL